MIVYAPKNSIEKGMIKLGSIYNNENLKKRYVIIEKQSEKIEKERKNFFEKNKIPEDIKFNGKILNYVSLQELENYHKKIEKDYFLLIQIHYLFWIEIKIYFNFFKEDVCLLIFNNWEIGYEHKIKNINKKVIEKDSRKKDDGIRVKYIFEGSKMLN